MRKPKSYDAVAGRVMALDAWPSHCAVGSIPKSCPRMRKKEYGMSVVNGWISAVQRHLDRTEGQGLAEYA